MFVDITIRMNIDEGACKEANISVEDVFQHIDVSDDDVTDGARVMALVPGLDPTSNFFLKDAYLVKVDTMPELNGKLGVVLKDDRTDHGGTAFENETVYDFIANLGEEATEIHDLNSLNKELVSCGIEPVGEYEPEEEPFEEDVCPICGSTNCESYDREVIDDSCECSFECFDCGATGTVDEDIVFAGFSNLRDKDNNEIIPASRLSWLNGYLKDAPATAKIEFKANNADGEPFSARMTVKDLIKDWYDEAEMCPANDEKVTDIGFHFKTAGPHKSEIFLRVVGDVEFLQLMTVLEGIFGKAKK